MSDQPTETTTPAAPVPPPPALASRPPAPPHESALHAHLRAVLHKLDEVKTFAIDGLKRLGVFIEHEAPVIASAAGAVASVIPGIGPAAAAVTSIVTKAAAIACTCGAVIHTGHGPRGCNVRGCGCKATSNPPPAAAPAS